MSYNYPYGAVPQQSYQVQNGAQVNPYGYASPVAQANPFSALVLAHGMRQAFSGSSSSSDPDVSVVTYDSYMDDKEFSTKKLSIAPEDIETHGKPLGLKFKDCGVVIPLPSKRVVCNSVKNQIKKINGNSDVSDEEMKKLGKAISTKLAVDFFTTQCLHGKNLETQQCNAFRTDASGGIAGTAGSIRSFFNTPASGSGNP